MSKFLFFVSLLLILTTQARAELLSGCAMAHGSLVHKVSNVDGELVARFDFPTFRDLEKDPSGQTQSLNTPLSNDGLFADRLEFLKEKQEFFEKVFGPKFNLIVKFDFCELQENQDKKLAARFCFKSGPMEINGQAVNLIEFGIQNQFRTSLVGSQGQTAQTEVVYADLAFTTLPNKSGIAKIYRSSFSYYPNGDSVQCTLN